MEVEKIKGLGFDGEIEKLLLAMNNSEEDVIKGMMHALEIAEVSHMLSSNKLTSKIFISQTNNDFEIIKIKKSYLSTHEKGKTNKEVDVREVQYIEFAIQDDKTKKGAKLRVCLGDDKGVIKFVDADYNTEKKFTFECPNLNEIKNFKEEKIAKLGSDGGMA